MTSDESLAVQQMRGVRYLPASWEKRFMRSMFEMSTITEKESAQLWRLFVRYRRQVSFPDKARLLQVAEKLAAPDLRKLEAARRKQEEINQLKAKYGALMS